MYVLQSPTSLKVTLKQVREGAKLRTLFECLTMEYRLSQRFMVRIASIPVLLFIGSVNVLWLVNDDFQYKSAPAL